MKKLLSILGMIGMVATTTSVAVACKPIGQKEPNKEEKKKKLLNKKKLF
ncbi:Vmc-like lipoprotein signal peptide domain-containing protein [Mycoplasma sp. HU2014]|nr:lipoprotein [Mycoplasma sp. HU2014]MBY7703976.1 lipoprotein [Vibrio harveyi]